jgi:hypothetical protein
MRLALVPLAFAVAACANHPTPRFDPAVYAKLCSSSTDPETAKRGGCVLKDQGALRTMPVVKQ